MENEVIDDLPDQLFLFGSKEEKAELNKDGSDPGSWMDELLDSNGTDHPEPGRICDPEICTEDCNKCTIFSKPKKG